MTVCVATLFQWNSAPKGAPYQWGSAAIIMTDRMITAGDVEYEPAQLKVSFMTDQTSILIAGDYSVHAQALHDTGRQLRTRTPATPNDIALMYGRAIQAIKQRQAEDIYLAPLRLNTDTFIAQQREMSDSFVSRITDQLQGYEGSEVGAIVVGSDEDGVHLYEVDSKGIVDCFDAVGFAAVGIGAHHARTYLMQVGHTSAATFYPALGAAFSAKKFAELAPGVGKATDIHLVLQKHQAQPLLPAVAAKLSELYAEFDAHHRDLRTEMIKRLDDWVQTPAEELIDDKPKGPAQTDASVDERASAPAAKGPQGNEVG